MSERWEARSRRSLMGTAVHAATVYNTGMETEQCTPECTQAQVKVSKKKRNVSGADWVHLVWKNM